MVKPLARPDKERAAAMYYPYVTAELTTLWLPDSLTVQAPAVLVSSNRAAYRLTPAVHAALFANVEQLEGRWAATVEGLTDERRAALAQAASVLGELWQWLVAQSATGTVATEPSALPDVKKLLRECQQADKAVPLDEYNPTIPLPEWFAPPACQPDQDQAAPAPATGQPQPQPRRKRARPKAAKAGRPVDAIATGGQSAGMFDGL